MDYSLCQSIHETAEDDQFRLNCNCIKSRMLAQDVLTSLLMKLSYDLQSWTTLCEHFSDIDSKPGLQIMWLLLHLYLRPATLRLHLKEPIALRGR